MMTRRVGFCGLLLVVALGLPDYAEEPTPEPGAKFLFLNSARDSEPAAAQPRQENSPLSRKPPQKAMTAPPSPRAPAVGFTAKAIRCWVEFLDDQRRGRPVSPTHVFHSGDKIRLQVESNHDGYLHLLIVDSGSGEVRVLFPDPSKGLADDWIVAHQARVLPSPNHRFAFDQHPGLERLFLLFSDNRDELGNFLSLASRLTAAEISSRVGSKGLLIEVDEGTSGQAGLYAASRDGMPVLLELTLRHE